MYSSHILSLTLTNIFSRPLFLLFYDVASLLLTNLFLFYTTLFQNEPCKSHFFRKNHFILKNRKYTYSASFDQYGSCLYELALLLMILVVLVINSKHWRFAICKNVVLAAMKFESKQKI